MMKRILIVLLMLANPGLAHFGNAQIKPVTSLRKALETPDEVRILALMDAAELTSEITQLKNLESLYLGENCPAEFPSYLRNLPRLRTLAVDAPVRLPSGLEKLKSVEVLQMNHAQGFVHFPGEICFQKIQHLVFQEGFPLLLPPSPNLKTIRIFESDLSIQWGEFIRNRKLELAVFSACNFGNKNPDFRGIDSVLVGGCNIPQNPVSGVKMRGISILFSKWPGVVEFLLDPENEINHVFMEGMDIPIEDVYRLRARYGKHFEMEVESEE